jgi:23S rRNA (uracil1939-C5)-methyltransferase
MRVQIEKIVYPGRRLARSGGRTYFTDEGLPGETVEIEPGLEHKTYIEAKTTAVIHRSADRLDPRCGHYLACSSLQTLPYPRQLEAKAAQLSEILAPVFGGEARTIEVAPSPAVWRYRNRLRLSLVRVEGGRFVPAYHLPQERDKFVPVEDCHLASETANRLVRDVADLTAELRGTKLREVEVRESRATGDILLSLHWSSQPASADVDPILTRVIPRYPAAGVASFFRDKGAFRERPEWGQPTIQEKVGQTTYEVGPSAFFQVNVAILPAVLSAMKEAGGLTGGETVADVYGGLGTFGLALAEEAGKVLIVESDPANIRLLGENVARNKARNVTVSEGTSGEWMPWVLDRSPEVVILDPPRKGLDPEVVAALGARPAGKILYLSCNPTTLARDLAALALRGPYDLASVRGFDFFPHTPHIEALAVLAKR